jgi:hypothetical protein
MPEDSQLETVTTKPYMVCHMNPAAQALTTIMGLVCLVAGSLLVVALMPREAPHTWFKSIVFGLGMIVLGLAMVSLGASMWITSGRWWREPGSPSVLGEVPNTNTNTNISRSRSLNYPRCLLTQSLFRQLTVASFPRSSTSGDVLLPMIKVTKETALSSDSMHYLHDRNGMEQAREERSHGLPGARGLRGALSLVPPVMSRASPGSGGQEARNLSIHGHAGIPAIDTDSQLGSFAGEWI